MPLIEIRSYPEEVMSPERKVALVLAIKIATVNANVPGINKLKLVSVTFGGAAIETATLEGADKEMVTIIVEFLYKHPDRTRDVFNRLAKAIFDAARAAFPNRYPIEVLIRPFDPETGACISD